MENYRGICTACGLAHDGTHVCSPTFIRLMEIDRIKIRAIGDITLGNGAVAYDIKGVSKTPAQYLQELETEAETLREQL